MLADPKAEIERIASFLGFEILDEALSGIVQHISLSAMRQRDREAGHRTIFKEGANAFFFKGTNGRWKEVLSEDEIAQYEKTAAKVLSPDCARWLEEGRAVLS